MRTGVCNPRFLSVDSTSSPSRPGSMRSKMMSSNSSAFTRKNPSSPVGATTTSYFSRSSPSRRARATFASSSTTRMRNWLFPSWILVRSLSLIFYRINPHFCTTARTRWNRQVEAVRALPSFAKISGCPGAQCRGYLGQKLVVVRILLLKNVDESLSACHINAFARGIVVEVVRVMDTRKRGNHVTGVRVEHCQARGRTSAHKQAVIGLIQGHRKVHLKTYWPPRDRMCAAIYYRDLLQVR